MIPTGIGHKRTRGHRLEPKVDAKLSTLRRDKEQDTPKEDFVETKPVFSQSDSNNIERVRQIVLHRLKHDREWHQFDLWTGYAGHYVKFEHSQLYRPFVFLANEVMWQLLVQGVIAPGLDSNNLNLPWFHITEYGQRCIEAGDFLPHDPTGYMKRIENQVGQHLDDTVKTYIHESLLTFLGGHYLSATVMLGVASERCIDLLAECYSGAIGDPGRKRDFDKKLAGAGRSVKRRFDAIRDELLKPTLGLPTELTDALDIHMSGIFTLIRYSRNEVGHPTGLVVDRDTAHANLLLFPQYCKRIYGLIAYLRTNSV